MTFHSSDQAILKSLLQIKLLMRSSRLSSASQRFRTVSQPRIRSAQKIDPIVSSPIKARNQSAKELFKVHNIAMNPQVKTPKQQTFKQQTFSPVKPNIVTANVPLSKTQSPVKRLADNPPPKTKKQAEYGRKLEFPVSQQPAYKIKTYEQLDNRPMSSSHYQDLSSRSSRIKQQNELRESKISKAFEYLLDNNSKYLAEKSRLCCQKAKPHQELFNIPRSTLLSSYQEHYPPKEAHLDKNYKIQPQNTKQAFGLPDSKVCGNSTMKENHDGRQQKRPDLAEWREGFKLQGPIWGPSTYQNHYPNNGQYDRMVPIAVWNTPQTGLDFVGDSNHRTSYKNPNSGPAGLATWNNLHPFGNNFNPNRGTTYSSEHNPKQKHPIQQHKPKQYQIFKNPGVFNSQYNTQFKDKTNDPLNQSNKCPC